READPAGAAEEIDGGVGGDPRKPVGGLVQILELVLALECLDEDFLRQILGIVNIAHLAVDKEEDPTHVVGNKARLLFLGEVQQRLDGFGEFAHPQFNNLLESTHRASTLSPYEP